MKVKPQLTVLVLERSELKCFGRTVDSVMSQGCALECLVLTSRPSESLLTLSESFNDGVELHSRPGATYSQLLYWGISLARGETIAILQAGDVLRSGALQSGLDALWESPEAVGVISDWISINEDGLVKDLIRHHGRTGRDWIGRPIVDPGPGAVFRRSAAQVVAGSDTVIEVSPEASLWLRMGFLGQYVGLSRIQATREVERERASDAAQAQVAIVDSLLASEYCQLGRAEQEEALIGAYLIASATPELTWTERTSYLGWLRTLGLGRRLILQPGRIRRVLPVLFSTLASIPGGAVLARFLEGMRGRWEPWAGKSADLVPHDA